MGLQCSGPMHAPGLWKCWSVVLLGGLQVHSLSYDYNTHLWEISLNLEEKGFTSTPAAPPGLPGTVGSTRIRASRCCSASGVSTASLGAAATVLPVPALCSPPLPPSPRKALLETRPGSQSRSHWILSETFFLHYEMLLELPEREAICKASMARSRGAAGMEHHPPAHTLQPMPVLSQ